MKTKFLYFFITFVILILSACNSSSSGISVSDAWVRSSSTGAAMSGTGAPSTTAGYLKLNNSTNQADRLIGAESSAARVIEIHRSTMVNDVMSMQPVDELEIPAGGSVELAPGGYHLMLIDLTQPLAEGERIDITLIFEEAGRVTILFDVKG